MPQGLACNEPVGPVTPSCEQEVEVPNPQGFHMRPAQKVLSLANQFQAEIAIRKDNRSFNAKNILSLLQLVAHQSSKLTIHASGEDAEAAVRALADLIRRGFDEMPEGAAPTT
jgi:phosphotransferase system HPr (HPr) family protein